MSPELTNFQMYFSVVPTLSRGSFALYYGVPDIVPHLSSRLGSLLTPGFILLSVVIQVLIIVSLKLEARRIDPRNIELSRNRGESNLLSRTET